MLENFQNKIEAIAETYADLVAKRLEGALKKSDVSSTAMEEINDGIRMLNHVASTLERINRLQCGNDTNVLKEYRELEKFSVKIIEQEKLIQKVLAELESARNNNDYVELKPGLIRKSR